MSKNYPKRNCHQVLSPPLEIKCSETGQNKGISASPHHIDHTHAQIYTHTHKGIMYNPAPYLSNPNQPTDVLHETTQKPIRTPNVRPSLNTQTGLQS